MMSEKERCCERVHDRGDGLASVASFHPCPRSAAVERGGKPYCRQHDPEAVKVREAHRGSKA